MKGGTRMRKEKFITYLMCIIMLLLTACTQNKTPSSAEEQRDEMEMCIPEGYILSYGFDTIEEIMEALTIWGRKSYCDIRSQSHYVKLSGTYWQTLLAFESGSIKLAVPQLDGEDIPYKNGTGSNISILPYFTYNLPWIRYICVVDDINVYIAISCVSILDDENIDNAVSALEVARLLDPDAPNPQNYKEFDKYKKIYEKEIELSDRKVKALVFELNDDSRIYVDIYYDDVYIRLTAEKELLSKDFFKKFSIRYVS